MNFVNFVISPDDTIYNALRSRVGLAGLDFIYCSVYYDANTNTSTPIPPIQCVKLRQNKEQCASTSTSDKILAPVVVKPEIVSKRASV